MIQSALYFTLGFLCAGFLALMIAPTIWRRAARITQRRIEASVPLSLDEIQADKDRMRAEFAVSTRRLEMSVKEFRDKAAAQLVDIGRGREELKQLATERAQQSSILSDMETKSTELRAELRQREDDLATLSETLQDADRALEKRARELEQLNTLYTDASLSSTNRQVELLAREQEVEKLAGDLGALKGERRDAGRRLQDMESELRSERDAANTEKRKAASLERKVERMLANLADRDEKIQRSERDLAQLRDRLKANNDVENDLNVKLSKALEERLRLEAMVADLTLRLSSGLLKVGADPEGEMAKLAAERRRLDERLIAMTRENQKLRADLAGRERASSEDWDAERKQSALLREQMNDLAAEVIALTSKLDGPNSPILKALDGATQGVASDTPSTRGLLSLADRVRALKKASPASG